jgi:hypothetical protein
MVDISLKGPERTTVWGLPLRKKKQEEKEMMGEEKVNKNKRKGKGNKREKVETREKQ